MQSAEQTGDGNTDLERYTVEQLRAFIDHYTDGRRYPRSDDSQCMIVDDIVVIFYDDPQDSPGREPDDALAAVGAFQKDVMWACRRAGFNIDSIPSDTDMTEFYVKACKEKLDTDYTEI